MRKLFFQLSITTLASFIPLISHADFSQSYEDRLIKSPTTQHLPTNSALERVRVLNQILADKELSFKDRLKFSKELFGILAGRAAAFKEYGALSSPITLKSLKNFPISDLRPNIFPSQTGWLDDKDSFFPTNDWFQQIASYPKSAGITNTGVYKVGYENHSGGLVYYSPIDFTSYYDPYSKFGEINPVYDSGFILSSVESFNLHSFIKWQERRVGNMVRHIVYNNMSFYFAQGSVLQAAYYKEHYPKFGLSQPTPKAVFSYEQLDGGIQKYRIQTAERIYLFYGNEDLKLKYDRKTCQCIAREKYNGLMNACSIPVNANSRRAERLIDRHANVVIVRGQGSILLDGNYQFAFMCQDLRGTPTDQDPLVLLKEHHQNSLLENGLNRKTKMTRLSLQGELVAYSGSTFCFKAPKPKTSSLTIPWLSNGLRGISPNQAQEVISSGLLDKGLSLAFNLKPEKNVWIGGQEIYQIALTLGYAQEVMEIANQTHVRIFKKLGPIYSRLTQHVANMWGEFAKDDTWGTIVTKENELGNQQSINNHLILYSYLIYSLALIDQFEKKYVPESDRFLKQKVPVSGFQEYTNKDMGDFLVSDIGETGKASDNILYRNFDVYNGFSWLTGISGPLKDGNNTHNQVGSVFGSFAVMAWLNQTQPNSIPAQMAFTRWCIETQSLNTYFQIGSHKSVYQNLSSQFVNKHPIVSHVWQDKIAVEASQRDDLKLLLASQLTPVGANLMDNFLNNNLDFARRVASIIIKEWKKYGFDTPLESVLIATVARTQPSVAQRMIHELEHRGEQYFHGGTNSFILFMITLYAANEGLLD